MRGLHKSKSIEDLVAETEFSQGTTQGIGAYSTGYKPIMEKTFTIKEYFGTYCQTK